MSTSGSTVSVATIRKKPSWLDALGSCPAGFGPGSQPTTGAVTSLRLIVTVCTNPGPPDTPLSVKSTLQVSAPRRAGSSATVMVSLKTAVSPLVTVCDGGSRRTVSPGSQVGTAVTVTVRLF